MGNKGEGREKISEKQEISPAVSDRFLNEIIGTSRLCQFIYVCGSVQQGGCGWSLTGTRCRSGVSTARKESITVTPSDGSMPTPAHVCGNGNDAVRYVQWDIDSVSSHDTFRVKPACLAQRGRLQLTCTATLTDVVRRLRRRAVGQRHSAGSGRAQGDLTDGTALRRRGRNKQRTGSGALRIKSRAGEELTREFWRKIKSLK